MQRADDQVLQRAAWAGVLTAATVISTMALGCATPFPALAALSVLFMPRREAFALVGANFLINQAVGFGIEHWPLTVDCVVGGLNLGIACAACTGAAMLARDRFKSSETVAVIGAFLASFFAFEAALMITSAWRAHEASGLQTYLFIFYVNGLAYAGLLAMQGAATSLGFIGRGAGAPMEVAAAA
jgi:hypothetical protein